MADKKHDQPMSQPDPETTHTTDPQEHMKGPLSSFMQGVKHTAEDNDHPTQKNRDSKGSEETEERADAGGEDDVHP